MILPWSRNCSKISQCLSTNTLLMDIGKLYTEKHKIVVVLWKDSRFVNKWMLFFLEPRSMWPSKREIWTWFTLSWNTIQMWMQKAQMTSKNSVLKNKNSSHPTNLFTLFSNPFRRFNLSNLSLCTYSTPFFLALMQDDAEMFQALLDHQDDVNARGPSSL